MPKKPLRVPAARTGRGVRWTLEVSSNNETNKTSKAQKRAPSARKPKTARKSAAAAVKRLATTVNDARKHARQASAAATPRSSRAESRAVPAGGSSRPNSWNNSTVMMVAAAAVLIVVMAALAHDPARTPTVTLSAAEATAPASVRDFTPAEPAARTTTDEPAPVATAPVAKPARTRDPHLVTAEPIAPVKPVVPVKTAPPSTTPAAPASEGAPAITPVSHEPVRESLVASNQESAGGPVTITGCLEVSSDGDQFRLTDTDGAGAPKSRGWRSGFLMKRPAPVALVSSDASSLRKLVGQRIAATGLLDSREMRVRSFHSTGTCD